MKRIYIITEEGRVWGRAGMDWIETVFKPAEHEADETCACMGAFYNVPSLLLGELTKYPDSYLLLSYEHIDSICGAELQEFCRLLQGSIERGETATSWQILRKYVDNLREG